LRENFIEDEKEVLIKNLNEPGKRVVELLDSLRIATHKIDSLINLVEQYRDSDKDDLIDQIAFEKNRGDSLQRELTGTGIGNCLERGYLANIKCFSSEKFSIEIIINKKIKINKTRILKRTKKFELSKQEFIGFGEEVLKYCKQQYPECRFSVKVFDSEKISKSEFKKSYKLISQYFYAQMGI